MSRQQHPDAEEIARYQAGDIEGSRGRWLAAHIADCSQCASVTDDLAAVSTALASAPAPAMPRAVESRITAALAAEAATRQGTREAARPSADRPQRLRLVGSGRSPDRSHGRGFRPAMAALSAAACLVLIGFGYLLSRTGSSSSSSAASAGAPAAGAASAAARPAPQPAGKAISPTHGTLKPVDGQAAIPFLVTKSGTSYQQATLAAQVRGELNLRSAPSASASSASASSASSGTGSRFSESIGGSPPSQPLIGCVLSVTGNVVPSLVDRATYEGKMAYVIAVSDHAWVVGLSCTASNHDVIASVALPG